MLWPLLLGIEADVRIGTRTGCVGKSIWFDHRSQRRGHRLLLRTLPGKMCPVPRVRSAGRSLKEPWKRGWGSRKYRPLDSETKNEYEFPILSIAHAWTSVILEGKRDSRRHSTTSFSENVVAAGTRSYQMWEVLSFCYGRGLNLLQYK